MLVREHGNVDDCVDAHYGKKKGPNATVEANDGIGERGWIYIKRGYDVSQL